MGTNAVRRNGWQVLVVGLLAGIASIAHTTPAAAQLTGLPDWVWGSTLVPDPPLASGPTTLLLYGIWPDGCGDLLESTVDDTGHVTVRLRTSACADTGGTRWVATLPLDTLAAGMHTVAISLTLKRSGPDSTLWNGSLTFEVVGGGSPPPGPPGPPPPPPAPPVPPANPLLQWIVTDPNPPRPSQPMALIVGGIAPFDCPVVTSAAVIDTSHLALTLAPAPPCGVDSASTRWSHRFELGLQREGFHAMSLAITLAGEDSTLDLPLTFIVVNDSVAWGPPPDSLANLLSTNRPNPFVQVTRFSVSTDTPEDADVGVFDLQGRRVSRVFHGRLPAGTTQLAWNGFRDDGERAVAGVYFYRLEMKGRVVSRRLILLPRR